MTCVNCLITLVTSDFIWNSSLPKVGKQYIQKMIVGYGQMTHNFFDFLKFWADLAFFCIYCKYNPRQCLLMVNNYYNIYKSCLEQQRIGLPSWKTSTVQFIMLFWYCYFRNYCIGQAMTAKTCFIKEYFCQHVVHTTYGTSV